MKDQNTFKIHTFALISRKSLGCLWKKSWGFFFCLDLSHSAFFKKKGGAWLSIFWQSPWSKNMLRTWSLQNCHFWQDLVHWVSTSLVGTSGVCGSKEVSLRFEDWFPEPENPGAFLSAFQEKTSFNSGAGAAQTPSRRKKNRKLLV